MVDSAGDLRFYEALAQVLPVVFVILIAEYKLLGLPEPRRGFGWLAHLARGAGIVGLAGAEYAVLAILYQGHSTRQLEHIAISGVAAGTMVAVYLPLIYVVVSAFGSSTLGRALGIVATVARAILDLSAISSVGILIGAAQRGGFL